MSPRCGWTIELDAMSAVLRQHLRRLSGRPNSQIELPNVAVIGYTPSCVAPNPGLTWILSSAKPVTNDPNRASTRILIVSTVGVLIALFLFAAVRAARRASQDLQRHQEQYANELEQKWIDGEVNRLASGQSSHVHFYATSNSDLLVNRLAGMPEIRSLTFWTTDLSDNGLSIIAKLPRLEKLTVNGGNVGDSGLALLSQNQTLRMLHLVNLNLSNDGLVVLQSIQKLDYLTVYCGQRSECKLTDIAGHRLNNLKQLKKLNVGGGWLSSSAITELKIALPNCEIVEKFADDEW